MLPAALAGQSLSTAILEGTVTDSAGVPLPLAEILAATQDGGVRRTATSDPRGVFRLGFLPPGSYRLTVRRIGFRPVVVNDLTLRAGRVEQLTVTLASTALQLDSIVVQASALRINTNDTESGTRLTSRDLATLPIPDDAHNLVQFTPGARPDQIWGAANAQANNYQLDGVSVNHPGVGADFFTPATSWIQEIEVRGLGAGAEYGNFQGGLVNIITKSGTDRHEGELRTNGESWHLNGTNLHASEAGSEPAHRLEVEGQLRGPLLRNKVHYAAFGQYLDRGTRVLNRLRQVPEDISPAGPSDGELKLLGKVDWQPVPGGKDFLSGSIGLNRLTVSRYGLDGFQSAEATQDLRSTTAYYGLSWQRSWSARQFLEVKVFGFQGTENRTPYAGPDVPGIATLLEVNPRAYQNAEFRELRKPSNLGATASWDLYARTFGAEHHLKIGGEYAFASWLQQRFRNGGMTWRPYERLTPPLFDPAVPATWALSGPIISSWGGEVNLDSKVQNGAVFVQDYFRLTRRISINPGLRLGHWVGKLRRADGTGYFTPISTTAWDPRIGVMLDLDGHAGFVAKAHWGIFHQSLFAGFFDRAEGADVYSDEERWGYSGGLGDPTTTFRPEDRTGSRWTQTQVVRLSETGRVEGFKEPYVEQATLGLEKTFGDHMKFDALYVRRRNKDMVGLVDRNLANNYSLYQNITVLDRFFRPILFQGQPLVLPVLAVSNEDIIYWRAILLSGESTDTESYYPRGMPRDVWLNLTYQPDLVLTTIPEATRRFDQLQLTGTVRYPKWWVTGSATFTRLVGNLNSITGADDYTTSGAGPFVHLNEQTNFFGDLNNQSRFELKIQAGADLPAGFRGGFFLTHFEGDRVTPTLTLSDLTVEFQLPDTGSTHDPIYLRAFLFHYTNGQRIFVQPRGTYRYPSRTSLDLHLEHEFDIGATGALVTMDAFNTFGASTVTEIQTSVNGSFDRDFPSEYGEVRQRAPPRTFRLGLVLRW